MVVEVKHMPKVARNYQREDFSELACTDAEFRKRTKVGKAAARAGKGGANRAGIAGETAQRQPDEQPGNAACLFFGRKANP